MAIPKPFESILMNGSRGPAEAGFVEADFLSHCHRSGGPFGAEGPIIMTGGAFGS